MKALNLVNQKFGRLLVINKSHRKNNKVMWECLCDCGKTTYVHTCNLTSLRVRSCGCLKIDELLQRSTTHKQRHTKLYEVWKTMKQRCGNPKNFSYHNYGGRGISVCAEWKDSFENFYNWCMANGYQSTLTLDRINVNGNYEPSNCRWVNRQVQANNTRTNHYITYNGETHTIADWARITNISYSCLFARLNNYNWSIEKALITPINNSNNISKSTDI